MCFYFLCQNLENWSFLKWSNVLYLTRKVQFIIMIKTRPVCYVIYYHTWNLEFKHSKPMSLHVVSVVLFPRTLCTICCITWYSVIMYKYEQFTNTCSWSSNYDLSNWSLVLRNYITILAQTQNISLGFRTILTSKVNKCVRLHVIYETFINTRKRSRMSTTSITFGFETYIRLQNYDYRCLTFLWFPTILNSWFLCIILVSSSILYIETSG